MNRLLSFRWHSVTSCFKLIGLRAFVHCATFVASHTCTVLPLSAKYLSCSYDFEESMVVKEKIGNLSFFAINNRRIDLLLLEWYETNKRILHKQTSDGVEVTTRFLNENPQLTEGDVLYEDDLRIIAIEIIACEAIVVRPKTMLQMAAACYEIGNRHVPLFYNDDELLLPFEPPVHRYLVSNGFDVFTEQRKLLQPLKTSVSPHSDSVNLASSVFTISNKAE